jgi:thiamine-monophosphate kinase
MMPRPDIAGEEAFIETYFAPLAASARGAFGLKDDCAVLGPEPGHDLVLTTDAIAEGIHFMPGDRPDDIAWKALAVNVSDLAGKGAKPVGYLLSLAVPQAPAPDWIAAFTRGLKEAQDAFGLALFGGDTDRRSNAPLSITIMAFGTVPSGGMIQRATARAGDFLYVSGTLGDAALGLRLRQGFVPGPMEEEARHWLERRYLRPEPRLGLRDALLACATGAMDISDGLVKDLGRLCRAAGVAAQIEAKDVPLSKPAAELVARHPDLRLLALTGGDDYEVLAAVPPDHAEHFERLALAGGVPVSRIGWLEPGAGVVARDALGTPIDLPATGYDHFGGKGLRA